MMESEMKLRSFFFGAHISKLQFNLWMPRNHIITNTVHICLNTENILRQTSDIIFHFALIIFHIARGGLVAGLLFLRSQQQKYHSTLFWRLSAGFRLIPNHPFHFMSTFGSPNKWILFKYVFNELYTVRFKRFARFNVHAVI